MKLSPQDIALEWAYNELLLEISMAHQHQVYAFDCISWRPHHVLPTIPLPVSEYEPITTLTQSQAKEKMV